MGLEKLKQGCQILAEHCADIKAEEKALIITNLATKQIGCLLEKVVAETTRNVKHLTISDFKIHGEEPPAIVALAMLESDVIFCLTKMSMAHTKARSAASEKGARYLSLPDYSNEILTSKALRADFRAITEPAKKLGKLLTAGNRLQISDKVGNKLECKVFGRKANIAPGWCWGPGTLASPPDAEVNVAVIEEETNGSIIINGSIPHHRLGILAQPIVLQINHGLITKISGDKAEIVNEIFSTLGSDKTKVVAEFGIGLNPRAKLSGRMLEDEGCLGTIHLGVGSNSTIGGLNDVPFHLDFVAKDLSVKIDDLCIIEQGKILKEFFV